MIETLQILLVLLGVFFFWQIGVFFWYALYSHHLVRKNQPMSFMLDEAEKLVVLVGDSTACGVGAHDGHNAIAGRMARDFTGVQVSNWSKSAKGLYWVARRLEREVTVADAPVCDLMIIMAGGINVVYGVPLGRMRANLSRAIVAAKRLAPRVIIVAPNNVGLSPVLYLPFSRLYERRSKKVDTLFTAVAQAHAVACVSLFSEGEDCLTRNPALRAADKSHPNDEGYGLWWDTIRDAVFVTLTS